MYVCGCLDRSLYITTSIQLVAWAYHNAEIFPTHHRLPLKDALLIFLPAGSDSRSVVHLTRIVSATASFICEKDDLFHGPGCQLLRLTLYPNTPAGLGVEDIRAFWEMEFIVNAKWTWPIRTSYII